jgi:ProQ/FINO family
MPLQDTTLPGWMQGSPAVQTLARTLLARYPAAFRAEGAEVRPLKIGIDRDLQQALDVDPAVLRTVLGGYTRRRAYRAALAAPGAMRVDLAGQPVEPVTAAHQQWARQAARPPTKPVRRPRATAPGAAAPPAGAPAPVRDFTPYLPQGGPPMAVTATLKFVLREIPASREHDGLVYLALHNVPKGVPARVHLDEAPLVVGCPSKLWRTALQRTQALAASGPPLWIVEAHVGVQEGALLAVVKGIQVLAGKPPAPPT